MRHIRMHGLKPNDCLSRQSAVRLYFKFLIGYNYSLAANLRSILAKT